MKKRIIRITAALCAAALLAGCGSISSKDGGYYTTEAAAQESYFTDFITSPVSPVIFALLFMAVTALIVYNGVEGGIEKVSRFMMPFIAMLSTILIGWIKTPDYVIGEMERNGEHFRRKSVYRVMIRYIAPVMMLILFLQSTGILS